MLETQLGLSPAADPLSGSGLSRAGSCPHSYDWASQQNGRATHVPLCYSRPALADGGGGDGASVVDGARQRSERTRSVETKPWEPSRDSRDVRQRPEA